MEISINNKSKECYPLFYNYVITEQIGSGSFGEVYLAECKDGNQVAIKIEDRKKVQRMYNEYKIYKYLEKMGFVSGLPKIYDYLQSPDYNIMVMQLLGPSLDDLFIKYKKKFKMCTVFSIALQLIDLLEQLHFSGHIHRDIKPNNFLIGRNEDVHQLYMMDFGLSKKYIINEKHMSFKDKRSLIGTARYASINMHLGFEPSRRDDMESVGFMLIYFLKGLLPWQSIKKQKGCDHIKKIGEIKICSNINKLCEGLPQCFKDYLIYCRKLKFDETPNYNYLSSLFSDSALKMKIVPEFEWDKQ